MPRGTDRARRGRHLSLVVAAVVAPIVFAGCGGASTVSTALPPLASTTVASMTVASTTVISTAAPGSIAVPTTAPPSAPTTAAPTPAPGCPAAGHGAVVDRARQRAWLCDGPVRHGSEMRVTTAITQPRPGTYPVFAKDRVTTSRFGGHLSYLDDFVAFTKGLRTGARIAFHAVPRTAKGDSLQPFESLGDLGRRGESSGCIRVLPEDAEEIWDWLALGDHVTVIS